MDADASPHQQSLLTKLGYTRQGMAGHVAEYLISRIVSGAIPAGAHLVEATIADELGISKTPVREALRRLPETGLVEHFPYRGTFVREITPRFVDEVISLRVNLETFAVSLAYPNIRRDDLEMLTELASQMEQVTQQGNHRDALKFDARFHSLFYERADHELLMEMWQNLLPRVELLQAYGRMSASPMPEGQVENRHLAIVEALRDGTAADAMIAVEEHARLGRNMIFGGGEKS